jgi:DNA-directed RNA polymerase specialized sigma24 family protein
MQQPGEPGRPSAWERALPVSVDLDTPPELFGSDLTHLFDYCRALQGQDAGAARTALSVLDSPHEALRDRDELRAWLFGLARSISLALCTPGRDGPPYLPAALIAASSQQTDDGVVRAFRALTDRDREILDLVYRHGIRPADLPAVLLVPAAEVYRCLAIAEEEFISLASVQDAGPGAGLEDIATLPLAALPTAESNELRPDARPGDLFLDRSEDPPGDRPDVRTGDLFLDRSEDPPGDRPDVRTGDLFLDRLEDPPGDRPGDLFLDRPEELFLDRPEDRPEDRTEDRPEDRPSDRPDDRPDDRPARRSDGVARGWRVIRPALQFVVAAAIPVAAVLAWIHFFRRAG